MQSLNSIAPEIISWISTVYCNKAVKEVKEGKQADKKQSDTAKSERHIEKAAQRKYKKRQKAGKNKIPAGNKSRKKFSVKNKAV